MRVCAPSCDGMSCPTDVPDGVTAEPTCAMGDQSGGKYCALLCQADEECDNDGGAKCAFPQAGAPGICVYPDSSNGLPVFLADTSLTVGVALIINFREQLLVSSQQSGWLCCDSFIKIQI